MSALLQVDEVFEAVRRAALGLVNAAGGEIVTQYHDGFVMWSPARPVFQLDRKTSKRYPTDSVIQNAFRIRFVVESLGSRTMQAEADAGAAEDAAEETADAAAEDDPDKAADDPT